MQEGALCHDGRLQKEGLSAPPGFPRINSKGVGYSREDLNVELFTSDKQRVLDVYSSREQNCCYKLFWPSFGMA